MQIHITTNLSKMAEQKKSKWPELVGKTGEEAKAVILEEQPNLNVIVLHKNSPTTRDLRRDRVWIFVHDDGTVADAILWMNFFRDNLHI